MARPINFRPLDALRHRNSAWPCVFRSAAGSEPRGPACIAPEYSWSEIRHCIDLRCAREIAHEQSFWQNAGVDCTHIPIDIPWHDKQGALLPNATDYADWYERILDCGSKPLARAFVAAARLCERGVVIICGHGKDRTGLLTAAILESAGIARREIVRDYCRSGPELLRLADLFVRHWAKRGQTREDYCQRFMLGEAPLIRLYARLDARHLSPLEVLRRASDSAEFEAACSVFRKAANAR